MKSSNNIKYLVGNKKINKASIQPFSEVVCDFLADLSEELNLVSKLKKYSDIKTLAFWCRKKNIYKLKKTFLSEETRLGLGLIFHITPSNIPTNFAYSLIFGLITGNSNIVKIPSKKFEQIEIICKCINKVLKKKHEQVSKMISIVQYSENDYFTKKISSICNARIIWGGDNSINNIRKFPLPYRSLDIAFADRYSLCAIDSQALLKLSSKEINRLTERFYNDTYLVDQNACSSPHLVLWLGKQVNNARNKFWNSLNEVVKQKYNLTEAASMDKFTQLCTNILNLKNLKKYDQYDNFIYTLHLKKLDKNIHNLRGKWGFFYEHNIKNLKEIKNYVNNKYQTLTYFGISKNFLKNFIVNNQLEGIDRVVPIGQALDINFFWDGYDLNRILTRVIDIK